MLLILVVLTFWEVIVLLVFDIICCAPGINILSCIQLIEMQLLQSSIKNRMKINLHVQTKSLHTGSTMIIYPEQRKYAVKL